MDSKLQEELNKLIEIGNEKKMIRTSTVAQLLYDLKRNSQNEYEETIEYLESRGIGLEIDDSEKHF